MVGGGRWVLCFVGLFGPGVRYYDGMGWWDGIVSVTRKHALHV